MALTVSFSVQQNYTAASTIVWTDTSTGSDVAVVKKRIFLQLADGTYLVPSGTTTDYVETTDGTVDLDVLSEDKALRITVQWLDVSDEVLYTTNGLYVFSLYAEEYYFSLTQAQTANPKLVQDGDYYLNKIKLRCAIDEAANAATFNDIYAAQSALDRAASFINNQTRFF